MTSHIPKLAIDLDGCVDEANDFFRTLTHLWPGPVLVITYRNDREKAIADLDRFSVRYTELFLASSFADKARIIEAEQGDVYIDDQPEMLKPVSARCSVLLFRNEGNFDFDNQQWLMSRETARLL